MTGTDAIRWETGGFAESERERLIEDVSALAGEELAVVSDDEEIAAVREALASDAFAERPADALGPQFIEGADPKLILIVLETCHILIETSKLGTHLENRVYQQLADKGEPVERVDPQSVAEFENP